MGWDMNAYIDIDKEALAAIRNTTQVSDTTPDIIDLYKEKHMPGFEHTIYYNRDEVCDTDEYYTSFPVSSIVYDERFKNRRYISKLEKLHGKEFPFVLQCMCSLGRKQDALDAAEGIETFFQDDERLMRFATWLRETSEFCSDYELD